LNTKNIIIDFSAILIIYFLPQISVLLNIPVYLFEPMRIIVVIAMLHSSQYNAYLLALLLPLFSLLLSNHPSVMKTFILSADLLLNIFLYFRINKFYQNKFLSMAVSIIISKAVYYLLKYLLIKLSLIDGSFVATPLYIQFIIIITLSIYAFLIDKFFSQKQFSNNVK